MEQFDPEEQRQGRAIAQFMWPFQHVFRTTLDSCVGEALGAIGFAGDHQVILVGFQVSGVHHYEICIEPETGPYTPHDLREVDERAALYYSEHPDRNLIHSNQQVHEQRHSLIRKQMRSKALCDILTDSQQGSDFIFFASLPTQVGDYDIHAVIGVSRSAAAEVPCLQTVERDRMYVTRSLLHAVIEDILKRASRALYMPYAGQDLEGIGARTPEVVRSAGEEFVRSVLLCAGQWFGSGMDLVFNSISALPYEGRAGSGALIIADPSSLCVEKSIELLSPIRLRNTLAVRKLMEAAGSGAGLLTDGEKVYGLANVGEDYEFASEKIFTVQIVSRGHWELNHFGHALMRVQDGIPSLPEFPFNVKIFRDIVRRSIPGADLDPLTDLALMASSNKHGAMLIISSDAASEANRLAPQAWRTNPVQLRLQMIGQITSMDGGILVDQLGDCHAVGVILDGVAKGIGDPARGSRFNNAVRYLDSNPPAAVVVVYSADGKIDILPNLHPQKRRQEISGLVNQFVGIANVESPNFEQAFRVCDRLGKVRFYLDEDQCIAINAALERLEGLRWRESLMRISHKKFVPDSNMNDSYWID